jgi:hypothetical protein
VTFSPISTARIAVFQLPFHSRLSRDHSGEVAGDRAAFDKTAEKFIHELKLVSVTARAGAFPFSGLPEIRLGEVVPRGRREIRDAGNAPIGYAEYRPRAGFDRVLAAVSATREKRPRIIDVRSPDGRSLMTIGVPVSRRWQGGGRSFEVLLPDGSRVGHVLMKTGLKAGLTFDLFGATGQPVGAVGWFDAPLEIPGRGVNPRGRSRFVRDPSGAEVGRFSFTFGKPGSETHGITFDDTAAPELPALCLAAELRPGRR